MAWAVATAGRVDPGAGAGARAGRGPAVARRRAWQASSAAATCPAGAFGEALADELLAPMDDLFQRYQAALARWPLARRRRAGDPLAGGASKGRAGTRRLAGRRAPRWRRPALAGSCSKRAIWSRTGATVATRSFATGSGTWRCTWQCRRAADDAYRQQGRRCRIAPARCRAGRARMLAELLAAWQQGMCRPLPLAAKTAFAYLKAGSDAARTEYEGGLSAAGRSRERRVSAARVSRFCRPVARRRVL
jgi:exodeoxyribonuclease V gamma subunit